jgi:hypothetical protein
MADLTGNKFDTLFFERYARISLIDLVDKKFAGLQNRDRPDLQDNENGIAIEVTRAIREKKEVAHALINKIAGRSVLDISDEEWIDVTNYGYGYGVHKDLIGELEYNFWAAALPLRRNIENKVNKVANGFYGDYPEFGLYIFSKDSLSDVDLSEIITFTINLQQKNSRRFDTMYISQIHEMFVCDLHTGTFKQLTINKSQCRKFYKEAIKKG